MDGWMDGWMDTDRLGVTAGARVASGAATAAVRWPPLSPEYSVIVQPAGYIFMKMVRNRRAIRSEYGTPASVTEWERPLLRQFNQVLLYSISFKNNRNKLLFQNKTKKNISVSQLLGIFQSCTCGIANCSRHQSVAALHFLKKK